MCGQLDNFSVLLTEHFCQFFKNPIIPENRILKCFQLPLVFTVKTVVMFCEGELEETNPAIQYNKQLQLPNFSPAITNPATLLSRPPGWISPRGCFSPGCPASRCRSWCSAGWRSSHRSHPHREREASSAVRGYLNTSAC